MLSWSNPRNEQHYNKDRRLKQIRLSMGSRLRGNDVLTYSC
jgi:hypothetical protein